MAPTLILPVSDGLTAAYLVPASLDGAAARELVLRALSRHIADPLAEVIAKLLRDDLVRVSDLPASEVQPLPVELQRYLGAEPEAVPGGVERGGVRRRNGHLAGARLAAAA